MTSRDNALEMNAVVLQLRELISANREQIAEMKAIAAQMQKDNVEFRAMMVKEFNTFKDEVRQDIKVFKNEVREDIKVFKNEVQEDMKAFKNEVREDIKTFKGEVRQDIKEFKAEVNTRFDSLEATVAVMDKDIIGLKHDVAGLYHWDYWLLSIILVVFAMPQIIAGIKALFSAIRDGIAGIIALFKK